MGNNPSYTAKTWPGAATWTRREDGHYDCRFGALGGSGKRIDTAEQIAELLLRVQGSHISQAIENLAMLGWLEVIEHIHRFAYESRQASYQNSQIYEQLKTYKS